VKVSTLDRFAELLLQLRAGEVTTTEVGTAMRSTLAARARYFHARSERDPTRQQTLLEPDDLVTYMELALFRAVDKWDPAHGVGIVPYVDYQVGRAAEKALLAAAKWPDPRRKPKAKQMYVEDVFMLEGEKGRGDKLEFLLNVYGVMEGVTAEDVLLVKERRETRARAVLGALKEGFPRRVVTLVLQGYSINAAADAVYGDPSLRIEYGLDSQEHAREAARLVTKRVRTGCRLAEA